MNSGRENLVKFATEHGKYTLAGDAKAGNRAHAGIISALKKLRNTPDQGKSVLEELAAHEDQSVRAWSSTYLLPLNEELATKTLEEVASEPGLIAFGAGITLREWRAGRLKLLC